MRLTNEIRAIIRKYAIKNAVEYGKASEGSVLNKIISLDPELKSDIKSLAIEVKNEVNNVNSMAKDQLEAEYSKYSQEFARDDELKASASKPKFVLEGAVEGKFATRYPPAPNGYMHIGHAKAAFLEKEFTKVYKGKLFLYFDDTNPEKDKQEYVDQFHKDLQWLGINFDDEYYASDYMEKMYAYAATLIKNGHAYACSCSADQIRKDRYESNECEHRGFAAEKNMKIFDDMLKGKYKENEMIIRLKGDMKAENTTLRDPTLLRIKHQEHYKQGKKYTVWPTYDLNTPIMDSVHGLTDVLRSKEFELRDGLSKRILTALNLHTPRIHSFSRLVIKNNITHKRELNKLISDGKVSGFDDPRLVTIIALKRRGILPEAINNFVLKLGMTKTDGTVSIDMLLAENKKLIDPVSRHLFFVKDPVKIEVDGLADSSIKLKFHPSGDMGFREYDVKNVFYISRDDVDSIKEGDIVRLKDLVDVKITSKGESISAEKNTGNPKAKIIQWVSHGNYEECAVTIPGQIVDDQGSFLSNSLQIASGYVESYAKKLKEHEIVQFERFGYCILDNKDKMEFIFTSK